MKAKAERDGKEHGIHYAEALRSAEVYVGVTPSK
jgi:hypothetical protein